MPVNVSVYSDLIQILPVYVPTITLMVGCLRASSMSKKCRTRHLKCLYCLFLPVSLSFPRAGGSLPPQHRLEGKYSTFQSTLVLCRPHGTTLPCVHSQTLKPSSRAGDPAVVPAQQCGCACLWLLTRLPQAHPRACKGDLRLCLRHHQQRDCLQLS